ncbi:MAG: hypothetical protein ACK4PR_03065 [Gammaproteobacteria bacterium]
MKKRKITSQENDSQTGSTTNLSFFPKAQKDKISREEKALFMLYRNKYFEKMCEDLKSELGDDYTTQAAEELFNLIMEDLRSSGKFKEILDQYLNLKIKREREQYIK